MKVVIDITAEKILFVLSLLIAFLCGVLVGKLVLT